MMKFRPILPAAVLLGASACASLPTGLRGLLPSGGASSSSSGSSSSTSAALESVAAAGSSVSIASEAPLTEAKLAMLLGADARFSASTLQGRGSPLCQLPSGAMPLGIWNVDFNQTAARNGNLDCFVINERSAAARPSSFDDFRQFDDYHMFSKPAGVGVTDPSGEVFATVQGGMFWAAAFGEAIYMLEAPNCEKAQGMDSDFVIRHLEAFCDLESARFDVLTKDPASAKQVDLGVERQAFLARAIAAAKERGADSAKADAEALKKVRFPKSARSEPACVQALKEYLSSEKTDIDASAIKKIAVTSPWRTTKSPLGLIMHRSIDVTVGFARTDIYAMDPNKKCAFATFEVRQEFDGAQYEAPFVTGAATGWTNIRCERLQ